MNTQLSTLLHLLKKDESSQAAPYLEALYIDKSIPWYFLWAYQGQEEKCRIGGLLFVRSKLVGVKL